MVGFISICASWSGQSDKVSFFFTVPFGERLEVLIGCNDSRIVDGCLIVQPFGMLF